MVSFRREAQELVIELVFMFCLMTNSQQNDFRLPLSFGTQIPF